LIDGIAPAGAGYLLMRGRGIPRVDVVGFERRVNYPLLRDRLKAALGGQAPVIQSAADGEQK
jgi:hypothetical protein